MIIEALLFGTFALSMLVFLSPDRYSAKLATLVSGLPLVGSLWMWTQFEGSGNALLATVSAQSETTEIGFETAIEWVQIGQYTLQWQVGVDGVSLPLLVLTTVLTTLALASSWTPIDERQSEFYGLMLLMETALIGVFTALDFFLWLVFWEGVLIPMYLLIAVWGGPRRKYAAIKFLLYTNFATLVLVTGVFLLIFGLGDAIQTISMPALTAALAAGELGSFAGLEAGVIEQLAFFLLFLGFAVKVPLVPFHTWLPDAHVEAPTPVSVMLAGVLLKMGTYALLRYNFTMLPEVAAQYAMVLAAIGVLSVIYGAMLALAQRDLKRIVAYSSISSMGYVILGLVAFTPHGLGGATFQMISHGLISGLMFMVVGVVYNATHTRMVGDMSGLADRMPWTVGIFVAGAFGYMGLPLMSGFAAEVLVFIGAFDSEVLQFAPIFTAVAMFGIVIVAGYLLWAMQRTLFGGFELETEYELGRAPVHDIAPLAVLLGLVILLGIQPDIIYEQIQGAVNPLVLEPAMVTLDAIVDVVGGGGA